MRLFIKRFCLFTFPLILVLVFFEIFLRKMDTSYTIKEEQIVSNGKNVELLILGNSHAARLDPRKFSLNAFNLAQVNQSLYFDKRITLKYIDRLKELKYVLISVDFHSLYFSDQGTRNVWAFYGYGINYKNSVPFPEQISYLAGYKTKYLLEFMKRSLSGKYNVIRGLEVEKEADFSQPIVKGFVPYTNSFDTSGKYILERAAFFNNIVRVSDEHKEIIADLEDFIIKLKARNIVPVLITMPCYAPFRELLDQKVQKQNRMDIQALSKKYKIPYLDYFTMPLSPDCYLNCDHVNGKGGVIISDSLNKDLGKLGKNGLLDEEGLAG